MSQGSTRDDIGIQINLSSNKSSPADADKIGFWDTVGLSLVHLTYLQLKGLMAVATTSEAFQLTGDITPTALSANQNNYNPTGLSTASVLRLEASGAARDITGLMGGSDGRIILLLNVGATYNINLKHENGSSTDINRFIIGVGGGNGSIGPGHANILQYDSTSLRWRVLTITDHTDLLNKGIYSHTSIDSHINDGTIHTTHDLAYFNPSTGRISRGGTQQVDVLGMDCFCENGDHIQTTSTLSASSLSLTASTLYHVYVYLSSGTPTIEVVTTAPASPYKGTARSKTSDSSRRYVGSVYATGTNTLAYWLHTPNAGLMMFTQDQSTSPWRVLANGLATTETTISFGSLIPAGIARVVVAKFSNTSATRYPSLGNSEDGITLAAGVGIYVVNLSAAPVIDFPLDASGNMSYLYDVAPATGLFVDLYGYFFER